MCFAHIQANTAMMLPEISIDNLALFFEASGKPAAWQYLQDEAYQNFFKRCLSNIQELSPRNQKFVLAICCRAVFSTSLPLWPAHAMLTQPETSEYATKLVQCMPYDQQASYLPTLITLPHKIAARVVNELSSVPRHAQKVADAVRQVEYRESFSFLGGVTVLFLIDYFKEQGKPRPLVKLARYFEGRALRQGVFTYCIAQGLWYELKCNMTSAPRRDTTTVHHSIYYMNYFGKPLDVGKCLAAEPQAMVQLANRFPSIAAEVSKERRRLLLLCRMRYQGNAQNKFWHDIAHMDSGPLSVIGKFI